LQLGIGLGVIIISVFVAIALTPFLLSNIGSFYLVALSGTLVARRFLYLKFKTNFLKNKAWTIKLFDEQLHFK